MITKQQVQQRLQGLRKLLEAKQAEIKRLDEQRAQAALSLRELHGSINECAFWMERAPEPEAPPPSQEAAAIAQGRPASCPAPLLYLAEPKPQETTKEA